MGGRPGVGGGAGQVPPAESVADLGPDADPVEVAKTIVARQLGQGPRTRSQLAAVLHRRGVPEAAAEAALDRYTELGYVDDVAFAGQWVQSRHAGKGLARRALRHELTRRGVAAETVRAAVDALDPDTERATAVELVTRRLPGMRSLPRDVQTRRLVGMLARKGYPPGLARAVVRDVLGAEADDADPFLP
jgi:regulatory protein